MKYSQIFILSVLFCALISGISTLGVLHYFWSESSVLPVDSAVNSLPKSVPVTSDGSVSTKLSDLESWVKALAVKVSPSVVSIVVSKEVQTYRTDPFGFFYEPAGKEKRTIWGGSGFFISKDGYILTNKHVVSDPNAEYTVILADGQELAGKILAYDPTTDLAIIRALVDEKTPYNNGIPVSFIPSTNDLDVGSFVVAIGNALAEFQNTLTFWVISGLGRSIEAANQSSGSSEALSGLIQTDTAINPGNSGGPLLNLSGQVVGINTAVSQGANGIGFAIPLSEKIVNGIRNSIAKYGKITRSFLGVRYVTLTSEVSKKLWLKTQYGAYIPVDSTGAIIPDSPADKAGLKGWDIIVEVNGQSLTTALGLKEILSETLPGDEIHMKVLKKSSGKIEEMKIKLGESP